MAIKGPKNSTPTSKGWVCNKTGELLKAQRISQVDIDEFNGVFPREPEPVVIVEPVIVEEQVSEEAEILVEEAPKPKKKKGFFSRKK